MDSIKIMEETSSNPISCAHRNMKQMRSPFAVSFISGERKSNSPTQKGCVGLRQTSSLRANKPKPKMTRPSVKKQGSWANTGGMWVIKNEIGRLAHDWWQCVYTDTKWSREWRIHLKKEENGKWKSGSSGILSPLLHSVPISIPIQCYRIDSKLLEDRNYVLPLFLKLLISGTQWMLNNNNWRGEAEEAEAKESGEK